MDIVAHTPVRAIRTSSGVPSGSIKSPVALIRLGFLFCSQWPFAASVCHDELRAV